MTKDIWASLSKQRKKEEIERCLQQLVDIESGKHNLSGTKEQGRLAQVKKDLERFILQTLEWEKGK